MATSLYTESDEAIAGPLTRLLLETKQEIPSFLESFKPSMGSDGTFNFDEDDEGMLQNCENQTTGSVDGDINESFGGFTINEKNLASLGNDVENIPPAFTKSSPASDGSCMPDSALNAW